MHADATISEETDWPQILTIYDRLRTIAPGPVVALNLAVVVDEVEGPAVAPAIVDTPHLERDSPFHAVRTDRLARCGRQAEAAAACEGVIARCDNDVEVPHLRRRPVRRRGG